MTDLNNNDDSKFEKKDGNTVKIPKGGPRPDTSQEIVASEVPGVLPGPKFITDGEKIAFEDSDLEDIPLSKNAEEGVAQPVLPLGGDAGAAKDKSNIEVGDLDGILKIDGNANGAEQPAGEGSLNKKDLDKFDMSEIDSKIDGIYSSMPAPNVETPSDVGDEIQKHIEEQQKQSKSTAGKDTLMMGYTLSVANLHQRYKISSKDLHEVVKKSQGADISDAINWFRKDMKKILVESKSGIDPKDRALKYLKGLEQTAASQAAIIGGLVSLFNGKKEDLTDEKSKRTTAEKRADDLKAEKDRIEKTYNENEQKYIVMENERNSALRVKKGLTIWGLAGTVAAAGLFMVSAYLFRDNAVKSEELENRPEVAAVDTEKQKELEEKLGQIKEDYDAQHKMFMNIYNSTLAKTGGMKIKQVTWDEYVNKAAEYFLSRKPSEKEVKYFDRELRRTLTLPDEMKSMGMTIDEYIEMAKTQKLDYSLTKNE